MRARIIPGCDIFRAIILKSCPFAWPRVRTSRRDFGQFEPSEIPFNFAVQSL